MENSSLTLPKPKFSLFDNRRARDEGMSGGALWRAPQKPPLSDPFPWERLVFVPFAADTIRCAALEGNWFDISHCLQALFNFTSSRASRFPLNFPSLSFGTLSGFLRLRQFHHSTDFADLNLFRFENLVFWDKFNFCFNSINLNFDFKFLLKFSLILNFKFELIL